MNIRAVSAGSYDIRSTVGGRKRAGLEDYNVVLTTGALPASRASVQKALRTLQVSAALATYACLAFVWLSAAGVVHWVIWIPFAIASAGVAMSNAIQLNALEGQERAGTST
jgi:hypothetical protein